MKTLVYGHNDKLKNHPLLNFRDDVKPGVQRAEYFGVVVTLSSSDQSASIQFSPHKLRNGLGHNYDNPPVNALKQIIVDIHREFELPIDEIKICRFEIGLNLSPPFNAADIVDMMYYHQTEKFHSRHEESGKYVIAKHPQYLDAKIYGKSIQYQGYFKRMPHNLLRLEYRHHWKKIDHLKISTLNDFIHRPTQQFKSDYLANSQKILFVDPSLNLDPQNQWLSKHYWDQLLKTDSRAFRYQRDKLKKTIDSGSLNIMAELDAQSADYFDANETPFVAIPLYYIDGIPTISPLNEKLCRVTGFNIEMQKNESQYISHTGLKFYREKHTNIYRQIERAYLHPSKHNLSDYERVKSIAKAIRDKAKNNKSQYVGNNQKRLFAIQW